MSFVKKILFLGAIFVLISAFAADNFAQHRGDGRGGKMGHGMKHFKDKHSKNLENLRLLKLLDALELDDDQNTKFIASFASFRKKFREIGDNVRQEAQLLSEMIQKPDPNDEEILARIKKIEEMKLKHVQAMHDFHKEVANILTPIQLAKMVLFEENFERELIESVRGFRERMMPSPQQSDSEAVLES